MSTRPLVSARIASAISLARVFIGCETGRLFAYLYVNSAFCAKAPMVGSASVPAAPARIWRRVICMWLSPLLSMILVVACTLLGPDANRLSVDCEGSGRRGFPRLPELCGFPQFSAREELFADVLLRDLAVAGLG